ncbi:MAG: VWA domain-containing protein [Austwickia sp.]|nr:VWA domain-containing protein [Austwickia sp.]
MSMRSDGGPVADVLLGFVGALRSAGLQPGPDEAAAFVAATAALGAHRRDHVYWAGRACLSRRPEDLARYDAVFAAYFDTAGDLGSPVPWPVSATRASAHPDEQDGPGQEPAALPTASRAERLRAADLARLQALSAQDRAAVYALLAEAARRRPRRRAHRGQPGGHARIDVRRSVRVALRYGGEPVRLRHLRPGTAPRRVVFVVDVSGSMHAYAQSYLLGAAALLRAVERVEVFTTGTRLTRVTPAMRGGDLWAAPAAAAAQIPDWHGGTSLGHCLRQLTSARTRSALRGALVVVLSDGWERGSTTGLTQAMARLSRLARRVYWGSPHAGATGFEPGTAGLRAAMPYVDRLLPAATVGDLVAVLNLLADPSLPVLSERPPPVSSRRDRGGSGA